MKFKIFTKEDFLKYPNVAIGSLIAKYPDYDCIVNVNSGLQIITDKLMLTIPIHNTRMCVELCNELENVGIEKFYEKYQIIIKC